jgi:DNA-binding MarR family transcriptional regulator
MESIEADRLWDALSLFRYQIFDQMQGDLASLGLDLSMPQSIALTQIAQAGPLSVSSLQQRMQRSQATTSHLATQLELRGLVTRSSDPADARRTLLQLSKEGTRLMNRLEQARRRGFRKVLAKVPEPVQRQLESALLATLEALKEAP